MRTLCHFQLKTGEPRKDLGPFQTAKLRDILDERKGGHEDARRARGRSVVPSPSESGPGPLLASWLPFSLPSESFRYFFKPAHVGGKCTSWNKTEYRKKHQRGAAERVGDRGQCGRGRGGRQSRALGTWGAMVSRPSVVTGTPMDMNGGPPGTNHCLAHLFLLPILSISF